MSACGADARRCLAYLTIEARHMLPRAFRAAMGNRIFGCDDCLAVCPWNKFAQDARDMRLLGDGSLNAPELSDLAALDDAGFREKFSGSPIKRIGRDRFVRNVLYAIGNSGDQTLRQCAATLVNDPDEKVADAARWAMARLDKS